MKYYIDDILDVLSESTLDYISIVYPEIYSEKVETNILDKTIKKTMTLYHGSNKDLSTIKPLSVNMGTRLSKIRMSSFWAKDPEYCILWAGMFIFHHLSFPYRVSLKDKKIYTIDTNYANKDKDANKFKHASEWLKEYYKTEPLYLYTLKNVPVKKIGRGQINADEYTIDEEVTPTNKKQITWEDLSKYISYISREDFSKLPVELYGRKGANAKFIEKLIFRDGKKTMMNRTKIYKNGMDQYQKGIGNHNMDNGRFNIDLKSAKKGIK